jgi:hypothetical protein
MFNGRSKPRHVGGARNLPWCASERIRGWFDVYENDRGLLMPVCR